MPHIKALTGVPLYPHTKIVQIDKVFFTLFIMGVSFSEKRPGLIKNPTCKPPTVYIKVAQLSGLRRLVPSKELVLLQGAAGS